MAKNPMLEEGFVFSSLRCDPLVDYISTKILKQDSPGEKSYSEGGGGSQQTGFYRPGQEGSTETPLDVYYFSGGDIAKQSNADAFLGWAMIPEHNRLIFAAREIGSEFARDLRGRQTGGVVFLLAKEDPWFEVWTEGEVG